MDAMQFYQIPQCKQSLEIGELFDPLNCPSPQLPISRDFLNVSPISLHLQRPEERFEQ